MARVRLFQFPLEGVTPENVRARTSTAFGVVDKLHPNPHTGTDLPAAGGTPIYPIYDGVVDGWGFSSSYGNWVRVKHDAASYSYYYHMLDRSNYDTGQPVSKKDALGWVGTTGYSTGNHLHFGVSGSPNFAGWVDPVQYVLDRYWYEDGTTPKPPLPTKPSTRHTAGYPVGFRAQADLSEANIAKILPPGTMVDAIWWQYGQGADGENRFLLVKQGGLEGYIHIGDIAEGTSLTGIPEYAGQIPKPPVPVPDPDPIPDPEPEPEPEPVDTIEVEKSELVALRDWLNDILK